MRQTLIGAAVAALLIGSGAVWAQDSEDPETDPNYPPKMGTVSGTLGETPVSWEAFDFSIGAFDASAWVDQDYETKEVVLRIMGYTPDDPDDFAFRLWAEGGFGPTLRKGEAAAVTVEILQGQDTDGPRLSSERQTAALVLDSIGPAVENSYLRHVTGSITAHLCPIDWKDRPCEDLVLRFDTDVQMGSVVEVTE